MQRCSISTDKYKIDISMLLRRRLIRLSHEELIIDGSSNYVEADTSNDEYFDVFITAVSELLLFDLSQFTIAEMVKCLPFPLEDRKIILTDAIRYSKKAVLKNGVKRELAKHFSDNSNLVLEGFMRFRMKDTLTILERCIDKATEEFLLKTEQMELMELLGAFVRFNPPRINEVSIILHPDGSCSVTDDSDSHIDYPNDARDSVVSLLVSLAPKSIIVYDLSEGVSLDLLIAIYQVFEDRVKVYRSIHI